MSKRQDKGKQVVNRWDKAGYTEVWHKNRAGATTKEGYRKVNHGSGYVTDYWGKTVHPGRGSKR